MTFVVTPLPLNVLGFPAELHNSTLQQTYIVIACITRSDFLLNFSWPILADIQMHAQMHPQFDGFHNSTNLDQNLKAEFREDRNPV